MSKSILLSIRPEWVAKILNEEKTIEVRKRFPKDYVGWVYIYCTKDKKNYLYWDWYDPPYVVEEWFVSNIPDIWADDRKNINGSFNGKVVARFYCDNVEEITTEKWSPSKEQDLLKVSCLTENQLFDYCNLESGNPFYTIHISKLEIFDKPRELSEFKFWKDKNEYGCWYENKLTKAPQNYCYIEGEE